MKRGAHCADARHEQADGQDFHEIPNRRPHFRLTIHTLFGHYMFTFCSFQPNAQNAREQG